jgi:dTDP-4-amino-4,6-dideoxygalactose transaminase
VEICAAMGLVNLDAFDHVVTSNRQHYADYQAAFAGLPDVKLLEFNDSERNNYHYIVAEVGDGCPVSRDEIVAALHAENIRARKYFWPGCHRMKPYRDLYPHAGLLLPGTERVAGRVVVLPNGTTLPAEAPETVAKVIRALARQA